jgi:hypothetical protein
MNSILDNLTQRLKALDGKFHGSSHAALLVVEQLVCALIAALALVRVGGYFPAFVTPVAILLAGGATFFLFKQFRLGVFIFVAMAAIYFCIGQPPLLGAGVVITVLAAFAAACYFVPGGLLRRLLVAVVAAAAAAGVCLLAYQLIGWVVEPLNAFTVGIYNKSPVLASLIGLGAIAYVTYRQPRDQSGWSWVVTPVVATIFCAYCWSPHSYVLSGINVLVGIVLSVYAFIARPTEEKQGVKRPLRSLAASAVACALFLGLFVLANESTWVNKLAMANALEVADHASEQMPDTNISSLRLIPRVAWNDVCAQSNPDNNIDFGNDPHPVVRADKSGVRRTYAQCLIHPARVRGHLLRLTGGVEGTVLVDLGERGKFAADDSVADGSFLFGDRSDAVRLALLSQHPGSVPITSIVSRATNGKNYLVVTFASKVPHGPAMIPDLGGVMAFDSWGFSRSLTPAQAADMFPDVAIYPPELQREYIELWGERSSLFAWIWSGEQYEVSEFAEHASNHYPFLEDFVGLGQRYALPLEKTGPNANRMERVALFSSARLQMDLYDTDNLRVPGPKQMQASPALTRPGLNVMTDEAIMVTHKGLVYWLLALRQPNSANDPKLRHGYSMNILIDGHAQDYCDVVSAMGPQHSVQLCLDRVDHGQSMQDFGQQLVVPSAPK